MSLNRYVKVPSVQSGKFNLTTLNRIDFELDPDTVYDLDNSWIELNMNVEATESTSGKVGVHKIKAVNPNDATINLMNVMLVKNCHLRSAKVGMLEDIRDVNVLRSNLSQLMESSTSKEGKSFKQLGQLFGNNSLKSSMFRELHKEGNVLSTEVQAPVRIKMSELFNLGSLREFDCRKLGRSRCHIELDNVLEFQAQSVSEMGGVVDMNDVVGAATNINSFTSSTFYELLEDSPFWVGEVVSINATGVGGASNVVNHYAVITEIVQNLDYSVTITVDTPLTNLAAAEEYQDLKITPVAADTVSFTIDYAEMVTQVVSNPSAMSDKLSYSTYTTEQYNANGLTKFQRLYQVEPEAVSLMVMFPNNVLSSNTNITDYRLKIDNVDQTDRNVEPHTSLYYNLLNDTMLDVGLPVSSLNEYSLDCSTTADDKRATGTKLLFIPAKLDQTQREKNVQVNINATGGGVALVNLYKLVVRQV